VTTFSTLAVSFKHYLDFGPIVRLDVFIIEAIATLLGKHEIEEPCDDIILSIRITN
jgi:hypothetical protein